MNVITQAPKPIFTPFHPSATCERAGHSARCTETPFRFTCFKLKGQFFAQTAASASARTSGQHAPKVQARSHRLRELPQYAGTRVLKELASIPSAEQLKGIEGARP